MGEAARCPGPVELVIESRPGGGVLQRVNDGKESVLLLARHQERAVANDLVRAAMDCRRLDAQSRGGAGGGGKEPTAFDDATDNRVADVLCSPMFHLPPHEEGPSCGRRVDLRRADANAVRVLTQMREENILITKDLDAPFAGSVDAVERLPQRVAMHCQRRRHAIVVRKHRSETQRQHRALQDDAVQDAMMLEDKALDPIRIAPDIVERGAGLWRQVADERSQPTAGQRPYGTTVEPIDRDRSSEVVAVV